MNKVIRLILFAFFLTGCGYEPILVNKNYDFFFSEINSDGDIKINENVSEILSEKTNFGKGKELKLYFFSKRDKQNISSNRQGDATIFKINIIINYTLIQDDEIILKNKISKQSTYNNINDKFELLRYEENIIKNLSEKSADEILMSITTIRK